MVEDTPLIVSQMLRGSLFTLQADDHLGYQPTVTVQKPMELALSDTILAKNSRTDFQQYLRQFEQLGRFAKVPDVLPHQVLEEGVQEVNSLLVLRGQSNGDLRETQSEQLSEQDILQNCQIGLYGQQHLHRPTQIGGLRQVLDWGGKIFQLQIVLEPLVGVALQVLLEDLILLFWGYFRSIALCVKFGNQLQ
jgi:hypothetical protein